MKKLIKYLKLMLKLKLNMVKVNETMDLSQMAETYAKYVCKMEGFPVYRGSGYAIEFCSIDFAFMNGYIKALHDNGLEFQNGLVKKRNITKEMPSGAFDIYIQDEFKKAKTEIGEILRNTLSKFETSKTNINAIAVAFEEELKKVELKS